MVGASFAVLDQSGIMKAGISRIVQKFGGRKYLLLGLISFFFMALGAYFGIFEEVVPLVPIMVGFSYYLGWDSLVGLGMSILATNMGFSPAITNPFTIGVAQIIAGLPLFSGAWFRFPVFAAIYGVFIYFLIQYARKIDQHPESSIVYVDDKLACEKYTGLQMEGLDQGNPNLKKAVICFLAFVILILLILISGPFVPGLSDYALPIVGLFFLIGGVGAGWLSGIGLNNLFRVLKEGILGIAPGIVLILMAVSVKHIVVLGGVLDTILHMTANSFSELQPFPAAILVYFLTLLIEFFIGSGSVKAFLLMPILLPLSDLLGVTRQVTVLGYCFGDGFSNMIYPTNPVLLISLGLTVVGYSKWIRWTAKLWGLVVLVSVAAIGIGVAINYGPF